MSTERMAENCSEEENKKIVVPGLPRENQQVVGNFWILV